MMFKNKIFQTKVTKTQCSKPDSLDRTTVGLLMEKKLRRPMG